MQLIHSSLQSQLPQRPDSFCALQLRVAPSQSKHKLYVGNIPKELTTDTLKQELSSAIKGETHAARPLASPLHCALETDQDRAFEDLSATLPLAGNPVPRRVWQRCRPALPRSHSLQPL